MNLVLELALRIVSEANKRGHWAKGARRAAEQRGIARLALQSRLAGRPPTPFVRAEVLLQRLAPRELDGDNLQRALKAVRDGVADALGIDDRDKRVTWSYGQGKLGVKRYGVRVDLAIFPQ